MGRAFEVRKASMAKTGAKKAKVYSKFGKELYICARNGGTNPDSNLALKHLIEKAKKAQVPGDIIKRNIDKAGAAGGESYTFYRYEGFGPGGSALIVDCLSDNVNRTVTDVRNCFTKTGGKLGVNGSVIHGFEHLSLVGVKDFDEEELLEILLMAEIDVKDIEEEEEELIIYGAASELFNIKKAIEQERSDVEFTIDEQTMLPTNFVELTNEEDNGKFSKLLDMLEDCDDVQRVYHNVKE
ncbi:YebC/PmpR family DNA-binding transcriptional regulator [Mycoplasmatota bacterium zrk1]